MSDEIELVARLLAFENGRAMPIASHRQIAVQPHAMVLCPLAMAGEDTTVHIVACGQVGEPPQVRFVPDPRQRDDQYELFVWLGAQIETYFRACAFTRTYPQLWVSSGAARKHLDTLADRLRYNRQNAAVRRFGELLSYVTERAPVAGQQALHAATSALRAHWVTGQPQSEEEHLGVLLTWLEPPDDGSLMAAIAAAEREPMGVKTRPEFDHDVLGPLVAGYNRARRQGASLKRRAALIRKALEPIVLRIYEATQTALRRLQAAELEPLPHLAALEQREFGEFEYSMRCRDAGIPLPLRDRPRGAAFGMTSREDARENFEAAVLFGDRLARARGRMSGKVLVGRVENPRQVKVAPRRKELSFELLSEQPVLHLRRRDRLCWTGDPRLAVVVDDVLRQGQTTRVWVRVTSGQRVVGLPEADAELELVPSVPNWGMLGRNRVRLKKRLNVPPWTHEAGEMPASAPRVAPADPLSSVEALR